MSDSIHFTAVSKLVSSMLIDTHAHLDEQSFHVDLPEVLDRAQQAGVNEILTIGITLATSQAAVELAKSYPQVHAVVGIQPNYVAEMKPDDFEQIVELAKEDCVVGIGETGLDRYWDHAPIELQVEWFRKHIELSQSINKPFIVHCREAEVDVVEVLRECSKNAPLNGVMHSFCGDRETADACLELGMHISFAGMVTFKKNNDLREVAKAIPLNRIFVETDSPYLAPVPLRGKRNEPANVVQTARCLADLHDLTLEEFANATTENAQRFFSLS